LIDVIGRRKLQIGGFIGMVLSYTLCGALMDIMVQHRVLFYFLYGLSFFFCQGPNVTTYVLPSEVFPTSIRATCHGISSAMGKVGAVVGGALMPAIMGATSLSVVMYVSAGVSMVGLLWASAFTHETLGQPLPHTHHMHTPATKKKTNETDAPGSEKVDLSRASSGSSCSSQASADSQPPDGDREKQRDVEMKSDALYAPKAETSTRATTPDLAMV
jgi:hypothetical protein